MFHVSAGQRVLAPRFGLLGDGFGCFSISGRQRVPALRFGGTNNEHGLRYFISPMDSVSPRCVSARQTTSTGSDNLYPPWTACPRVAFQRDKRRARARVICVSVSLRYITTVQTTRTGSGILNPLWTTYPRGTFRRNKRRTRAQVFYIPHGQRVPALRFSETNDEPGLG